MILVRIAVGVLRLCSAVVGKESNENNTLVGKESLLTN